MTYTTTLSTRTKVLVATIVLGTLACVVTVSKQASHQATLTKQAEFEASTAIQLAARERSSPKLAVAADYR